MKYASFLKFGAVIGAIGMASVLSACGDKATAKDNVAPTENKTLKVAIGGNMPPFTFIDGRGSPIGFDVDLIKNIATKNGYEVKFNVLPWASIFESVEHGDSDMAISAISYTTERDGRYLLSNPYVYMPTGIVSLEQTKVDSIEDVKSLRLGVQKGTIFEDFAIANGVDNVLVRDKSFLNFQDLVSGRVDVIMNDKQMAQYIASGFPEYKVNILEHGDINNKNSHAVALTVKHKAKLMEMFNAGIAEMRSSGELAQLESKWFENGKNAQNDQSEQ